MPKQQIFATKPLVIDGKNIDAGAVLATIETDHPVNRVLAGLANGSTSFSPPAKDAPPPVAEAEANA